MGRSRIISVLIAALCLAVVLPTAPVAAARAADPELVSVRFLTPQVDVEQGWGTVTVAVHLRYAAGLPDTMLPVYQNDPTNMVTAAGGAPGLPRAAWMTWGRLDRVSGTATDGVWQNSIRVSPAWNGSYTVTQVQVTDREDDSYFLPVTNGPVVTVSGGRMWSVNSVRTPIRIVTGAERWRPQARITDTVSGSPVGGARVKLGSLFDDLEYRAHTTEPGTAADAAGLWTSPVTWGVQDMQEARHFAYGGRGNRGWSLQGIGCVDLTVKVQASATYSDTSLTGDQPLVVTGNVWPAPALGPGGEGPILLQRDLGAAGWQTLATATARQNGRYTITWIPVQPGAYSLRVRIPGNGGAPCTTGTVGTTLATTTVRATW